MDRIISDWQARLSEENVVGGGVGGAPLAAPGHAGIVRKNQQSIFNLDKLDKEKEEAGPEVPPGQPKPATLRAPQPPLGAPRPPAAPVTGVPGAGMPKPPAPMGAVMGPPKPPSPGPQMPVPPSASATGTPKSGGPAVGTVKTPPSGAVKPPIPAPAAPAKGGSAAPVPGQLPKLKQPAPKPANVAAVRLGPIKPGEDKDRPAGSPPPGLTANSHATGMVRK